MITPLVRNALRRWSRHEDLFTASRSVPACAGISGGRTSALMAALLEPSVVLTFQNTGREHPKTLDFLAALSEGLGRPIVWLEFRPPRRKAAPPREFEFAVVSYQTADRSGGPFEAFMQALADYRESKGEEPVSPWARGRICTAYMKQKVQEHWVASQGWEAFDSFVGLRFDEPERVHRLKDRDTVDRIFRAPLFDAGITKSDVLGFWSEQAFDLGIVDRQGNCTGCFLKDQTDLSRVLQEPETEADWWIAMQARYRNFGGQRFPGYALLKSEGPGRLEIEAALRGGATPQNPGWDARRFRLVVIQERKRIAGEVASFSCSCEQSFAIGDAADDLD